MNAEELWKLSGLEGDYEAWKFGEACDELSDLVKRGIKTATSSSYLNYLAKEEKVPQAISSHSRTSMRLSRIWKEKTIVLLKTGEESIRRSSRRN